MNRAEGVGDAARGARKKAKVAVARKLAAILHRMWREETPLCWTAA